MSARLVVRRHSTRGKSKRFSEKKALYDISQEYDNSLEEDSISMIIPKLKIGVELRSKMTQLTISTKTRKKCRLASFITTLITGH